MNVAFIPVHGSKSIPKKNIKLIRGRRSLVYWTIKAACECKYIEEVYMATDKDNNDIKNIVENFKLEEEIFKKVKVIRRSDESASHTASTEYAMLEFAKNYFLIILHLFRQHPLC